MQVAFGAESPHASGIGGTQLNQSQFTATFPLTAGDLTVINAAAGGTIGLNLLTASGQPTFIPGPMTPVLTLVGTGTGGTPVAYTFEATVGPCNNGCNLLTVQLLDNAGKAATPATTQLFSLSSTSNGVSFNPTSPITITNPATSITDMFCGLNTGNYQVTITPGAGPLSGVPAQTITVYVCGSIGDTYLTKGVMSGVCTVTRLDLRDAICRELFGFAPIDNGQGLNGDLPTGKGFDWATMGMWNQRISETISDINTRCKFHTTVNMTSPVPATTTPGPQFISLAGTPGCPTEAIINTVRRAVWYDATAPTIAQAPPLTPTSFQEQDRLGGILDNYNVGIPSMFFMVGYQIALLPGSVNGGALSLYAGTAITQFVGDTDYIDQLPNDYLPIIVLGAAFRIARSNLDKLNMAQLYPELKAAY
jgi:hypothetical protein